ncbi:hypothetical protein B0H19DRAFT_1043453 [Mycena capillaripes]|nr:hypothetical protein B0H19DRAFT_1043453 [Mycena capillaripes]
MLKPAAIHALTFLFIGLRGALAVNERCCFDGTPGVCTTDAKCGSFGGFTVTGLCPGGKDNKCCIVSDCNFPNSLGSQCVWVDSPTECLGGTRPGLCPGPNGFKCCTSGVQGC